MGAAAVFETAAETPPTVASKTVLVDNLFTTTADAAPRRLLSSNQHDKDDRPHTHEVDHEALEMEK